MANSRFSRRTTRTAALVLLVIVFILLALVGSRWMRADRIDLTSDKLYTLTSGTEQIVDSLHAPLKLTLYFSDHATADSAQLRSYEQRVREMLQEMVARSHGRIRLQIVDPVPYSDEEASAEGYGLSPVNVGNNGERVFFGLVGSTLRQRVLDDAEAGVGGAQFGPQLGDLVDGDSAVIDREDGLGLLQLAGYLLDDGGFLVSVHTLLSLNAKRPLVGGRQ